MHLVFCRRTGAHSGCGSSPGEQPLCEAASEIPTARPTTLKTDKWSRVQIPCESP